MEDYWERKQSAAGRWARRFAIFSAVLLTTAGFGHRYELVDTMDFFWLLGLVLVLAVAGAALAIAGLFNLIERGARTGVASIAALFVSMAVLAPYALASYLVLALPTLSDVATDPLDPPLFSRASQLRTGAMNRIGPITEEAAALQAEAYPELAGRRYELVPETVIEALDAVLAGRGWELLATPVTSDGGLSFTVELSAPTFVLRFPVDAAIRVTDEGESSYVDMRMSSRYGRHDLGDGARRIASFMADLDREVILQAQQIGQQAPPPPPESAGDEDPVE
jgi:hypothetical protein